VSISVIINSFHDTPQVSETIRNLQIQNSPCPFEIVLVSRKAKDSYTEGFRVLNSEEIPANLRRYQGFQAAKYPLAVFLDDDCVVKDSLFIEKIWQEFLHDEIKIIAGLYNSSSEASYFSKAYNTMSNFWVLKSRKNIFCENFLGGIFCLRREYFPCHIDFKETPICGGDEQVFIDYWRQKGIPIHLKRNLIVEHQPRGGAWSFIRRGWAHGFNKKSHSPVNYKAILENFNWSMCKYLGAFALHYLSVSAGFGFRRILKAKP
jgi:hypothetical protein